MRGFDGSISTTGRAGAHVLSFLQPIAQTDDVWIPRQQLVCRDVESGSREQLGEADTTGTTGDLFQGTMRWKAFVASLRAVIRIRRILKIAGGDPVLLGEVVAKGGVVALEESTRFVDNDLPDTIVLGCWDCI